MTQEQGQVRVVAFRLGEQEYVVDLAQVQELIRQPDELLHLDSAPAWVAGLVQRRGRLVPVIDLRRKLGLAPAQPTPDNCIIILKLPVGPVGFLADSASELLWAERRAYDPPSPVVVGVGDEFISGLARIGDHLRVMLDLERLLTPESWQAVDEVGGPAAEAWSMGPARADQRALVVFELGSALYGVPVTETSEVREPPPYVPLPNVPGHVRGLINLHGTVMPLIDLLPRLGLAADWGRQPHRAAPASATAEDRGEPQYGLTSARAGSAHMETTSRVIVLKGPGYPAALLADVVHGLWRLPRSEFQPVPPNLGFGEWRYCDEVTRVGPDPGRALIVLNVSRLLAGTSPAAERKQSP
jgi:purine-binding chemotaxis protein CheW